MSFEPFKSLPRFRAIGDSKFIASCPTDAHARGDQNPGLSGKLTHDRILLHCQAGCSTQDIIASMGLAWADLFLNDKQPVSAKSVRRQAAAEGFRQWRDAELIQTAETLRLKDSLKVSTEQCLSRGLITEQQAYDAFADVFHDYAALEYRFEVLRTGSDTQCLEIYRNGRH
jgi:putative DNA primase/helicase